MLVITRGLTTTSLLLVQRSIRKNVRQSIAINLRDSVAAFQDFRHERETMLTNDVALLADLPITRAIMGSPDPVTIQDASQDISQIATSDLFVLVDHSGKSSPCTPRPPDLPAKRRKNISSSPSMRSVESPATGGWEIIIFTRLLSSPSIAGRAPTELCSDFSSSAMKSTIAWLADVSKVAGSEVAFSCGNEIVGTTLTPAQAQSTQHSGFDRRLGP